MRGFGFLVVCAVLAGCIADAPRAQTCVVHDRVVGDSVVPGAWGAAMEPGAGFGAPYQFAGVPVGPVAGSSLVAGGNVSHVVWRPDGGPVEEAGGLSVRDGVLVSPEYLELQFFGNAQAWEPVLSGVLDPARPMEDAVAVVRGFLVHVRGEHADNDALARDAVGPLQAAAGPPMEVGSDAEDAAGAGHGTVLPAGPWTLAATLDGVLAGADDDLADGSLVAGPWRFDVEVPSASLEWMHNGTRAWMNVDALDRVWVEVTFNGTASWTQQEILAWIAAEGVPTGDATAWTWSQNPFRVCGP